MTVNGLRGTSTAVVSYDEVKITDTNMLTLLLWLLLLAVCWPLALIALFLYPLVWVLAIPFRLVGITVTALLELVKALFLMPARVLRGR